MTGRVLAASAQVLFSGLLAACCALPVGWLVWQIVGHWDVAVGGAFEGFRLKLLARTVAYNGMVAVLACAMAWPVALVIGRGRGWIAGLMAFVLPVALLLPSLTYSYAWAQALRLVGWDPSPQSAADVARCVWTLAGWLWPVPAAVIGWTLRRMDDQVQQQALLDGALWRVTLRELAAPAVASAAIVGVLACQEFSVWERTGISVVATETRMVFETGSPSSASNQITAPMSGAALDALPRSTQSERAAEAAGTTLPLLAIIVTLSILAVRLLRGRTAGGEVAGGASWPRVLDARPAAIALAVIVLLLTLGVPIWALFASMKRDFALGRMWTIFSPQILGSLFIAACVGAAACAVALIAAVRLRRWALVLAIATFLIGGQLIAIAMIRAYNRPGLWFLYDEAPIVILAHLARFAWIPLAAGAMTFGASWRSLRDMAAVDGATPWESAARVIWPLAWPILAAAGALCLILSLGEAPATVLLVPQRPPMIVPLLTTWVHLLRSDDMIEATLVTMFTVMTLTVAALAIFLAARKKIGTGAIYFFLASLTLIPGCGRAGEPDEIWLETGTGAGQVVYPRAIAYSPKDDTFFVVDRVARVQHLDRHGKCLAEWRMPEWDNGKPVGLSVGPDGNLYVPDTHYARVIVYTPDGKELRRWGSHGTGKGQFIFPTDVAFDDKGRIFVSEYGDHDRIQVFDAQANYLYEIGSFGDAPGQFSRPDSMVINGDTIYVTDNGNHRIAVFKTDGTFLRNMGSVGSGLGEFRFPRGMDEDDAGHLVVCEFGNNRVQLIDKQTGQSAGLWGAGGHSPGQLAYPWGVAHDKHGRTLVVDAGNNRLQVFRF